MKKENVKDIVLPHSKAKLDLYKSYLEKYLPILTLAKGISKINLYDIFCGAGMYKDGNIGSPLISVEVINKTNDLIDSKGWKRKPVVLNINDGAKQKIDNVRKLLNTVAISNCKINFFNLDADAMLDIVTSEVNTFQKTERSLVFIDPYGYSNIDKGKIFGLLQNGRTEIVLFLPAMQMYRFSEVVMTDFERKCYEDLRKFILEFLPDTDKFENVFDFINELTIAFSYGKNYYSCSHYIERDKGNYYAVFFITSNIYGLEKMLEVKWKQDASTGKGFKKDSNGGLFGEMLHDYDRKIQLENLKNVFISQLKKNVNGLSNVQVYVLTLQNEFLPKHINIVIRELKEERKIKITDKFGNESSFGNASYIDYDHYKSNSVELYFKIK